MVRINKFVCFCGLVGAGGTIASSVRGAATPRSSWCSGGARKMALSMMQTQGDRWCPAQGPGSLNSKCHVFLSSSLESSLAATNGLRNFSIRALRARDPNRVVPPVRSAGRSCGAPVEYERPGPVWRFFWDGERRRLGFPREEDDRDEENNRGGRWSAPEKKLKQE